MNKKKPVATSKESGRRKAIKAMAIGGTAAATSQTLPDRWGKPFVDSVLLPGHATSSPKVKKSKARATD